jgi:hypothetical protein
VPARPRTRRRSRRIVGGVLAVLLVGALAGGVAVVTNAFGAGDRAVALVERIDLVLNPPPDRPIDQLEEVVTPRPSGTALPAPARSAGAPGGADAGSSPGSGPGPTTAPTPPPGREAVDVNLYSDPADHFITEIDHEWCAVAGTQMVIAAHGRGPLTNAFQRELASRIREWDSWKDSHNGDWGPAAIVKALAAYGVPGYKVRIYDTRQQALADAARAIEQYGAPVILIAWRGAHTWVMTGFKADADPLLFDDARVSGTYILDPWYPRVSTIWGPSDPPGTFQDAAEMRRNYLPWQRPEGLYPTRDGKFLAVVPTQPLAP